MAVAKPSSPEPEDRRSRLAVALTALCTRAPLSDTAAIAADFTLLDLAKSVESEVRLAMAEKLADCDWAPIGVVRELAFGPAESAEPILERSLRLDIDALLQLAETGPEHRLALAGRKHIPGRLTLALSRRGESPVMRRLAENPGAEMPDAAAAVFASSAANDVALQETLARRPDLGAAFVKALRAVAADSVRRELAARYPDLPGDRLAEAASQAAAGLDAFDVTAGGLVAKLAGRGQLSGRHVLHAAHADRYDVLEYAIGQLIGMTVAEWRHALAASGLRACMLAARVLDYSPQETAALHDSLVRAGSVHHVENARLRDAIEEFMRVYSREEARRALRRLGGAASIE